MNYYKQIAEMLGLELVREDMRKNKVKCILLPKRSTKHSA